MNAADSPTTIPTEPVPRMLKRNRSTCQVIFMIMSIVGFLLTRKWVRSFKSHHNDVVSCFVATIGVLYAVLLAMIAVASWNNYTAVDSLVSEEADLVHAMFRDADAFPWPHRERFRSLLREYVDTVIHVEWPSLQQGLEEKRAAMAVDAIYSEWVSFVPATDKESVVATEIFQRLNTFQSVRRSRIQTGLSGLMPVLWIVVVVGAVLNLGMSVLDGRPEDAFRDDRGTRRYDRHGRLFDSGAGSSVVR